MSHRGALIGSVLLTVALGCGGGSDEDDGGDSITVETQSVQCSATDSNAYYAVGTVVASGTASGPTGSTFAFAISNGAETDVTFDCGGWTEEGAGANNTSCRNVAGPESITWAVTQSVYWCKADCDPSTALNNGDDPNKHTTATITAPDQSQKLDPRDVTCQG